MLLSQVTVVRRRGGKGGFDHGYENRRKNTPIGALNTRLHILVAHYQTTLFVPRRQHHPLIRPCVQLVQAGEDVGEVYDRVEIFVHLVEDVVPEEFDDVSVTGF